MANSITHLYLAKNVLEKLPKDIKEKIIMPNKDAFMFGSIGPDYLFALRELNDKNARYCNIMQHSHMFEVFSSVAEHIRKNNDNNQLSYALGLLCHYVLDCKIHPFVNFFVEEELGKYIPKDQQAGIHSMIELAIDDHVITELMGYKNSNDYCPSIDLKTSKKTKQSIALLYKEAINTKIGLYPSLFKLKLAMFLSTKTIKFFTDKTGKKRRYFSAKEANSPSCKKKIRNLMHPPELYKEVDFLNLRHLPFRKVRNLSETDNKDAIEIISDAIPTSVALINKFLTAVFDGTPLDKNDFMVNYEGVSL